jgi:DnaJ-class molecular chaperone
MATCDTCSGRGEYRDSDGLLTTCGACGGSGTAR